jgi:hypothetical protein
VDSGDIKKGAVKTSDIAINAVNGAKAKDGSFTGADAKDDSFTGADVQESSLGTVPSAASANSANTANSATTANTANSANTANTANNASNLGGAPAGDYLMKTAQSGQTLSGQVASTKAPDAQWMLAGSSYPVPLPEGVPEPVFEYLVGDSVSDTCPGIGQSTSGRLCIYVFNSDNVDHDQVNLSGNDPNRRYGFSLDVFASEFADPSYILANWAYQVP